MEAGSPRWSPDGRRVAFDMVSQKGRAIFVVNADGGAPRQCTEWADAGRPSWSRDGRWIYFGADAGGSTQVFKVPSDTRGTPSQVTRDGAFEAFESLDGKTLFYIHDKELRRMPTEGGPFAKVSNREIRMGTWSVAADGIFFVDLSEARFSESVARGPKTVYRLDPSTGASQKVASITGDLNSNLPDFCVSPDGKTLYYSIREVSISQIRMIEGGL
jgi:Tol biopolymer transport system component